MGIFSNFFAKLKHFFTRSELNDEFFDELERTLISSDMGVETSENIVQTFKDKLRISKTKDIATAKIILRDILIGELKDVQSINFSYPVVITVIGVNGVGKTTSIAKMANYFSKQKKSVVLIAADTFRAGAVNQIDDWAKKVNVRIVKQNEGADSGSVVFDGLVSAKAKNNDVVIVDTAGRLHTKTNLMNELQKIDKIINREAVDFQKLNLIVLDASIGQNSIQQVKAFKDSVKLDGIIVTKLDGTAKGGVVFQIVKDLDVPVIFTCFGEKIEDIAGFDAKSYIDNILM